MSEFEPQTPFDQPMQTASSELRQAALKEAGWYRRRVIELAKFAGMVAGAGLGAVSCQAHLAETGANREEVTTFLEEYNQTIEPGVRLGAAQYEALMILGGDEDSFRVVIEEPSGRDEIIPGEETGFSTSDIFRSLLEPEEEQLEKLENDYEEFTTWDKERQKQIEDMDLDGWEKYDSLALSAALWLGLVATPVVKVLYQLEKVVYKMSHDRNSNDHSILLNLTHRLNLAKTTEHVHPEWLHKRPSRGELRQYLTGVEWLPPVGSKIVTDEDGQFKNHAQPPQLTAEQIVTDISSRRKELGEMFVHHLTVQGRLPDEFKYAGVALLLSSPHNTDWDEPLYSAPWGQVGPMIHDGGNTRRNTSRLWRSRKVRGRTDFIQRVYVNFDEGDAADQPEINALANQAEGIRMLTEAKFFQRAALAMHCKNNTAPRKIPRSVRRELSDIWSNFETGMIQLLQAKGMGSTVNTRWFTEEGEQKHGWPGVRYEADYEQMKESLRDIDSAKKQDEDGSIRAVIQRAMVELSEKVDKAIGIN